MRKEQIITTTNNNQMEEKGMKQRFIHFKRKFVPALSGAIMGVMLMSTTCFAAGGTSAVTQPLENLKTLVIAVIGAKLLNEYREKTSGNFRFEYSPESFTGTVRNTQKPTGC